MVAVGEPAAGTIINKNYIVITVSELLSLNVFIYHFQKKFFTSIIIY